MTVPRGLGSAVAKAALEVSIQHVTVCPVRTVEPRGDAEIVSVETSTPMAKAFLHRALSSGVADLRESSITTREVRLAGMALVAALGGPLQFDGFKSPMLSAFMSLIIGAAAGCSTADDTGRRYLIGVAAPRSRECSRCGSALPWYWDSRIVKRRWRASSPCR